MLIKVYYLTTHMFAYRQSRVDDLALARVETYSALKLAGYSKPMKTYNLHISDFFISMI